MTISAPPPACASSFAADLVDDREIRDASGDLLSHQHVADLLADVVLNARKPSNVALFGPWGSGKSGIGHLLQARLQKVHGVKFARFDAFKYAENPLRRHFIDATATELGITDSKYHADLYVGQTRSKLELPTVRWQSVLKVTGMFVLGALAIVLATVLIGAWVVAATSTRPFWTVVFEIFPTTLLALLPSGALVGAFSAMAGRYFTVNLTEGRPDSQDEFETRFRELVKASAAERLVIFVDELDRCSSKEVVATLEAVRTFFGSDRCIFVVAADRQVLEEALDDDLAQATPPDVEQPYYSTGSAFLDKVFQYHVSIPPMEKLEVQSFARRLVADREGIWSTIEPSRVLPVLIPSHVTSPRRVKNLLNAYATAYRLAEKRVEAGQLSADLVARQSELARLVTLQVEFPLFARHLQLEHRLPSMVLAGANEGNGQAASAIDRTYPRASADARALALRFVKRLEPVDLILADVSGEGAQELEGRIRKTQADQLISYLSRTSRVGDVGRDLVYMRTMGSLVNLDGDLGERITQFAEDHRMDRLQLEVAPLSEGERSAVAQLLIGRTRNADSLLIGNYARCYLELVGQSLLPVTFEPGGTADALSQVVATETLELDPATIRGAWRIGCASDLPGGITLRTAVIQSPLLRDSLDLAEIVLSDPRHALAASGAAVADLLAHHLLSVEASEVVDILIALSPSELEALLQEAADPVGAALNALVSELASEVAPEPATTAPPARRTSAPSTQPSNANDDADGDEDEVDLAELMVQLERLLTHAAEQAPSAAEAAVRMMLLSDSKEGRAVVEPHLGALPVLQDPRTTTLLLTQVAFRTTDRWPEWLSLVDPSGAAGDSSQIVRLAKTLWSRCAKDNPPVSQSAIRALGRLVSQLTESQIDGLQSFGLDQLDDEEPQPDELDTRVRRLAVSRGLAEFGLSDAHTQAFRELTVLTGVLAMELDDEDSELAWAYVDSEFGPALTEAVMTCEPGEEESLAELARGLSKAALSASWPDRVRRTELRVQLATTLFEHSPTMSREVLPDLSAMMPLFARAQRAAANWLRIAELSDAQRRKIVTSVMTMQPALSEELANALERMRRTLVPAQQAELLAVAVEAGRTGQNQPSLLRALGLTDLAPTVVASLVETRYNAATNNEQRVYALDLWVQAGLTEPNVAGVLVRQVLVPILRLTSNGKPNATAVRQALARALQLPRACSEDAREDLQAALDQLGGAFEPNVGRVRDHFGLRAKPGLLESVFGRRNRPR